MGWKAEAKEIKQKKYGIYCVLCREKGIEPVPYHFFEIDMIKKIQNEKSK